MLDPTSGTLFIVKSNVNLECWQNSWYMCTCWGNIAPTASGSMFLLNTISLFASSAHIPNCHESDDFSPSFLSLSLYDDDFFPLKKVTHLSSTSPRNKGWSNFTKLFYSLACLRYRIKDISNSFINTLIILYPIYILDKLFLNIIWVLMYFSVFNYIFRWPLILYRKLGFNTLSGLKFHLNNFVIFVQFFKNKAFEC